MGRANIPFVSFNRGLLSPKALARVDLDRTRLSAEVMTNWIAKTQGAMSIRPGTKYMGSSLHDTGAEWIEFIASTDDVALLELTHEKMRVWLGEDAHALELLARPKVDTTLSITDTGWSNASTGGTIPSSAPDIIPIMTAATTSGVTISASSDQVINGRAAWKVADDNLVTFWQDTGATVSSLPSWLKVDFGAGNARSVARYSVRAGAAANQLDNAPRSWDFQGNDVDTGSDASWATLDTGGDQSGWAISEKRTFAINSPQAFRFYRINVNEIVGGSGEGQVEIAELEMFEADSSTQARFSSGQLILNAGAIGSMARAEKRLIEVA